MPEFTRSVDAKLLGRNTFNLSVEMGAPFSAHDKHYVFSRQPPPASVPAGVEFISQSIGAFAERLRDQPGKNIWMMGGGKLIASFLDEDAIDEFIVTVVPIFIGEGIPLIAPRHLEVPLKLRSVKSFPDGVVQVHYDVRTQRRLARRVTMAHSFTRTSGLVVAGWIGVQLVAQASPVAPAWRDPSPHQLRWLTVDSSVKLEVLDWGGAGPPIVLLGCYLSAHVYDEFAPKLMDQFHVYGITRRGIGASDKPTSGYMVQRSADDVLEVLDALNLRKALLVGTSCAGQILTVFASQHSDRLNGLVYLDGASDPTVPAYDPPMPDPTTLPRAIKPPPAPDYSSFEAYRIAQRRDIGFAFPESELRQQFVANPDGSVGGSLLSPVIRRAITIDARVKPNYSDVRVPVLAIYQADHPFEEVAAGFAIRNEQERAALRQQYEATRAMYIRWQRDLRAGLPSARIVELVGANLFMFLSNPADVLREIRAFVAR